MSRDENENIMKNTLRMISSGTELITVREAISLNLFYQWEFDGYESEEICRLLLYSNKNNFNKISFLLNLVSIKIINETQGYSVEILNIENHFRQF